jgi:trimethylamine---corrinoid protein Co-methyltransferase
MERFRDCFYRPFLSSSDNYDRWSRNGKKDTATRANEIYKKMLEEYEAPAIDIAIKEELDEYVAKRSKELTA